MRTHLLSLLVSLVVLSPLTARAYEPRHVFITNRGGGNVVELSDTFEYQRVYFAGGLYEGLALSAPNGMAFTPDGSLFIADTSNDRIIAFTGDGAFIRAFSTLPRMGRSIESIYFNGEGVLFASANAGLGVVGRYSQMGAALPDVVSAPEFSNLGNVNLTSAGLVIVSDFSNRGRGLRELDPATGMVVRTFGMDIGLQEDVMIDGADRVFVSHLGGNEIVVFGPAPARAELYRFTAPAEATLPLLRPTGIALTYDCHLLVASFENGAIFVFRHEGAAPPTFLRVLRPGMEIPAEAMLGSTESIAIAGLSLPGSFDEFADRVPSCDELVPVDAGPRPDASALPEDAAVSVDSGARTDGGRRAASPSSGCGCAVGSQRLPLGLALPMLIVALGFLGRKRATR